MLDTAIVGLGNVAGWHRRALARTEGARLVAVADVDRELARRRASEWGVAGYGSLEALLEAESVDWVHVCTPVSTHADLATQSVRAGAHALVEKPATVDREAFESLVAAADDAGRRMTVVHNQVYYPPLVRARRLVRRGRFGRLRGVSVRWLENNDPGESDRGAWVFDLPGGEFGEGIAHPVYVGLRSAGYPADEDSVSVTTVDTIGDGDVAFDGLAVSYRSDDDVACTVQHHSGTRGSRQVAFFAEGGRVVADIPTQSVRVYPEGYGPNATVSNPLGSAAYWTVRNAAGAVRSAATVRARRALAAVRGREYTVHDTHTPVVRREAAAIRGTGDGPTPRAEADWTNRIVTAVCEDRRT